MFFKFFKKVLIGFIVALLLICSLPQNSFAKKLAYDFVKLGVLVNTQNTSDKMIVEAVKLAAQHNRSALVKKQPAFFVKSVGEFESDMIKGLEELSDKKVYIVLAPKRFLRSKKVIHYAQKRGMLLVNVSDFDKDFDPKKMPKSNHLLYAGSNPWLKYAAVAQKLSRDNITSLIVIAKDEDDHSKAELKNLKMGLLAQHKIRKFETIYLNPNEKKTVQVATELLKVVSESARRHSKESTAILVLDHTGFVDLLFEARRFDLLAQIKWYGNGAKVLEQDFLKDKYAGDFASQVNYTSFSHSNVSNKIYKKLALRLRQSFKKRDVVLKEQEAFASYDVANIVFGLPRVTFSKIKFITSAFYAKAHGQNVTGDMTFNKEGRRQSMTYDVWSVQKVGKRYTWKRVGVSAAPITKTRMPKF